MAESKNPTPPEPGKTFAGSKVRHGTASGWRLHQKREESPCDPCYRAKEVYDARWLAVPENTMRNRLHARAQAKAVSVLMGKYPEEYREAYEAAKVTLFAEHGLTPRKAKS